MEKWLSVQQLPKLVLFGMLVQISDGFKVRLQFCFKATGVEQ